LWPKSAGYATIAHLASWARAELSVNSVMPIGVARRLMSEAATNLIDWVHNSASDFGQRNDQSLWRFLKSVRSICFSATPLMTFGFVPADATSAFHAFFLHVDATGKSISIGANPQQYSVVPDFVVRISLLGLCRQIVVQSSTFIVFSTNFLGYQEDPNAVHSFAPKAKCFGTFRHSISGISFAINAESNLNIFSSSGKRATCHHFELE
jgi:hypothetical protein